jgi:MFS family permease
LEEEPTQPSTHLTPDPSEASAGRAQRTARALALDLTPLRESREFRLLFAGQAVSLCGSMMTFVALPVQTYELTDSMLATGLLGVAEFVAIFLMAFVGGALADAVDRRRMVLLTEALLALGTLGLVANSLLAEPRVWVLFVCAALFAALNGMKRPSLDALIPRIVSA